MGRNFDIKINGVKEFERALKRNPKTTTLEVKTFISRALAEYRRGIYNNPWRVGGGGGGVPVKTYGLKDAHITEYGKMTGRIYVRKAHSKNKKGRAITTDKYGFYVHEGTRKMKARPWLDYVFKNKNNKIINLQVNLLNKIVKGLAK